MTEQEPRPFIAVGIDGSKQSIAALRWAAHQASLTGAEVHAIGAWEVPATILFTPGYLDSDYERDALRVLNETVTDALGAETEVVVKQELVQGRPARALAHAAETAQLLVIGSHGSGQVPGMHLELPGMHLGSVANYCVHHAACPVVLIRD